jgi:bacterial/archaeal transporter family-2 protein
VIGLVALALVAGSLVSLSRQLNGRLALATSPLVSSFWNHVVGLAVLVLSGLVFGGLWPDGLASAPWTAWIGGPIGVVFIAASSWAVARVGASNTALLVIAGQMVSGVLLDLAQGASGSALARATGVALIIAGVLVTRA